MSSRVKSSRVIIYGADKKSRHSVSNGFIFSLEEFKLACRLEIMTITDQYHITTTVGQWPQNIWKSCLKAVERNPISVLSHTVNTQEFSPAMHSLRTAGGVSLIKPLIGCWWQGTTVSINRNKERQQMTGLLIVTLSWFLAIRMNIPYCTLNSHWIEDVLQPMMIRLPSNQVSDYIMQPKSNRVLPVKYYKVLLS